jgi:hypothetical protein
MKFKIETIENALPPKQQLLKRFQQQEEYLQARMKEPMEEVVQAEPFPSWETWFGELDVQLNNRLKNRPADEIRRARRQSFAELAFLLDIRQQLEQFVKTETEKIWAILNFFVEHVLPVTWRLDSLRQCKRCRSIDDSREQQKMAVPMDQPRDDALGEIEVQLSRVRTVIQEVARRFFDGHVPLLSLTVEGLDFLQKGLDFWRLQLRSGHVMATDPRKIIEESSSEIEAEVSDAVESMKDNAEIAMYNALGELDMARTQASKHLKLTQQALPKKLKQLEQLRKQLRLTQKKC